MMRQYLDVKESYDEYILLYRLGDFYECFFDDAVIASRELELTLTGRDCGDGKRAAMCGVPFHKADLYIGKLVEKGFKVAICEQIGDPKAAVGLVKREVTRVVTPGTVTDSGLLSEEQNNFLCSVCYGNLGVALCFADISTADISATFIGGDDMDSRVLNEMGAYRPSEVIINTPYKDCAGLADFLRDKFGTLVNDDRRPLFAYDRARELTSALPGDSSERLSEPELVMAVGALLGYIKETQKSELTFTREINVYTEGQFLELDISTRRNLELTESMRTKEKRGSLLWVLDRTKTAMGARLLRSWVLKPLLNPVAIAKRQSATEAFVRDRMLRDELGELLASTLDLERLTAKAVYGTANAKDLRAIYQSVEKLPEIKSLILNSSCEYLKGIAASLDTLDDICDLLGRAIVDVPPFTVREGGMIREGFNRDVDYYRSIKDGGVDIMQSIEQREREETGIKTLRVSYNKVAGYFIEVTKSFTHMVPDRYVRRGTLTNSERYITEELKEMENTIFGAEDKLVNLEFELFCGLRQVISENNERIRAVANSIAELDVFRSFGEVADKNGYVCPEVDLSSELVIKDGRHPVVERFVTDNYFVPNDTCLNVTNNKVMIITGPNMAGKSTYMRQVAIITIMAQIGSFVPAREARIGVVDKVFTRVGASDDLASGQSTFMLEMSEVANILKNATSRSLIIYDEVGRGTSTFDGMAIARAVVEYTYSRKIGAKTLFATHYHELTDMEDEFPGIVNYNIAAKKRGDSITFLRKIVRGGTDDSYGIEVAKLAGVPNEVVKRAREILKSIESDAPMAQSGSARAQTNDTLDLFTDVIAGAESDAAERIRSADLNTMTPIEAMNLLFELKKMLKD
ncbi:MAG: DNA mismatch repair protein MutS [Clostridia bacterium]|nr:DNA mismatch repair protein MutS [Clostridia bacterium]